MSDEEEEYDYCDICGRRVMASEIVGKCIECRGKKVCSECAVIHNNRVYCVDHAPTPQQLNRNLVKVVALLLQLLMGHLWLMKSKF